MWRWLVGFLKSPIAERRDSSGTPRNPEEGGNEPAQD
jgi:hypothetical protein